MKSTIVIGVDPGPEASGVVITRIDDDGSDPHVLNALQDVDLVAFIDRVRGVKPQDNNDRIDMLFVDDVVVVFEMIESYGLAVGREVFETCITLGRLMQASARLGCEVVRIARPEVKLSLCNSRRATDALVREACLVRYGGTKDVAVGTKKAPGPLYGVSGHAWAALAMVLAYQAGAKQFVYRKG